MIAQAKFRAKVFVMSAAVAVRDVLVELEALLMEGIHDLIFDAVWCPAVGKPQVADGSQLSEV